ncbi:MAG TPA: transposase, partial [Candidatus Limnocylindria bacterium]|nr:transposase [Candidatus Limnocylindria bacterium]
MVHSRASRGLCRFAAPARLPRLLGWVSFQPSPEGQFSTGDDSQGLKAAVQDFLPQAAWQRCTVHVMRNVLEKVPQTRRAEV